jgi:hypothetical protein
MARAQAFKRDFGAGKRRIQGIIRNAVRPDGLFACAVDGLQDGHGR